MVVESEKCEVAGSNCYDTGDGGGSTSILRHEVDTVVPVWWQESHRQRAKGAAVQRIENDLKIGGKSPEI